VISGAHAILFSTDAEADRAFLKDVLGLPFVDSGGGWLIFALPPAEVAVHPAAARSHELFLLCVDLEATLSGLEARGVTVKRPVQEQDWGRLSTLLLPSGAELGIYQPKHPLAPH
jgi:predicted enzyme related to lactoylglutathione lyase